MPASVTVQVGLCWTWSENQIVCYAPNLEEVEGAYWFGSVRPVCPLSNLSRAVRGRILKFGMWFAYEN